MADLLITLLATRGQALTRYAYLLCGDDAAADLLRHALSRMSRARFGDVPAPETYVKRAIAIEYLDRSRARSTQLRSVVRLLTAARRHAGPCDPSRPDGVRLALLALSPRERACLLLHFYEGLPVALTARTVGCSRRAVHGSLPAFLARLQPMPGGNVSAGTGRGSDQAYAKALLDAVAEGAAEVRLTLQQRRLPPRPGRRVARAGAGALGGALVLSLAVTNLVMGGLPTWRPPGFRTLIADEAHPLPCGKQLSGPLLQAGDGGARLAVTSVRRSDKPWPLVTVRLSTRSDGSFLMPGYTPVQVLLLRNLTIIDRIGTYAMVPGGPTMDWIREVRAPVPLDLPVGAVQVGGQPVEHMSTVTPQRPVTVTITGPGHCDGVDWTSVSKGGPYRLVRHVRAAPAWPTAALQSWGRPPAGVGRRTSSVAGESVCQDRALPRRRQRQEGGATCSGRRGPGH